jgi:hypothetical protein
MVESAEKRDLPEWEIFEIRKETVADAFGSESKIPLLILPALKE